MFHQNQLQFNLDVPNLPANLAARYRSPGPLVIEKLAGEAAVAARPEAAGEPTQRAPPLRLTTVSEDRLSTAVRLARLDLKTALAKKRLTAEADRPPSPARERPGKKAGAKKRGSLRQPADPRPKIRERQTGLNARRSAAQTQTPTAKRRRDRDGSSATAPVNAGQGLVLLAGPRQEWRRPPQAGAAGPAAGGQQQPASPPTKDVPLSPDGRKALEIRQLRSELKTYIRKVEELSVKASQQQGADSKKDAEEEAEEDPRRAARAAEQASRSARLLYSLQQQVREIQEELDRLGPGKVRHTKKSRALTRLAAAHRGAVRALQSFLPRLPAEMGPGSGPGLPPHYRELALLVRQLSLCCTQLDVDGPGIPEGVLNILEQAKDFQDALSLQTSSPPRPSRPRQTSRPDRSPRRQLAFGSDAATAPSAKPRPGAGHRLASQGPHKHQTDAHSKSSRVLREKVATEFPHKERERNPGAARVSPGPTTVERLQRSLLNDKATPGSPERNAALRAGLEALLRAGDGRPAQRGSRQPPRPAPEQGHPGGSGVSRPVVKARRPPPPPPPNKSAAPTSKSLILPAKLKAARERLQRPRPITRDAGFTQETVASRLKHRRPAGQSPSSDKGPGSLPEEEGSSTTVRPKPAWTPPGSPNSFHKVASPRQARIPTSSEDDDEPVQDKEQRPTRRKVVFDVDGESPGGDGVGLRPAGSFDPDLMKREVARQAWLDREAAKQLKPQVAGPQDGCPPLPPHWLKQVEEALTDRLQPLIDKAESSARDQQRQESAARQSLPHQLSQKATQATSNNADLLSDLLLEDVLEDTALELQRIEAGDRIEEQTRHLQDAPTVEGILQSLEKMESVEDEIRRRWKRVEYIPQEEPQVDSMQQREGKWLMGTPLDGDFLESFPGAVPTDHTSMKFTNQPVRRDGRTSALTDTRSEPSADRVEISSGTGRNVPAQPRIEESGCLWLRRTVGARALSDGDVREESPGKADGISASPDPSGSSHHLAILQSLLGPPGAAAPRGGPDLDRPAAPPGPSAQRAGPALGRPPMPLFIPSDMMSRVKDHRGRFEHHLKRTSHWAYGTFDPWKLVEEVSDDIVSEIIADVSGEVGEIMGHCVDELYKAEFDMT